MKTVIHIQVAIGNHQPYIAFQTRITSEFDGILDVFRQFQYPRPVAHWLSRRGDQAY